MLLIKTYTGPDAFGGTGLFAAEAIPAGTVIWNFDPKVDTFYSWEDYQALPQAMREENLTHTYPTLNKDGKLGITISFDNDRFINHSFTPNVGDTKDWQTAALRDIAAGEELTTNYHDFVPANLPAVFDQLPLIRFLRQVTNARSASAAE